MPDYKTPEALLIRKQDEAARAARRPQAQRWPSSPRAAAPTVLVAPMVRVPPRPPLHLPGMLTAARLKVSVTLDAVELLGAPVPEGRPRVSLRVRLPDRTLTAEIASKALRKAQKTIRDNGAGNVALTLQGRLAAGDVVADAGISAQSKAKPGQVS